MKDSTAEWPANLVNCLHSIVNGNRFDARSLGPLDDGYFEVRSASKH